MTGKVLADKLLSTIEELVIDTTRMVGQCYDGASAMSGRFNGAQMNVRAKN